MVGRVFFGCYTLQAPSFVASQGILCAYTAMHAAVELQYKDGFRIKPEWPLLVGELRTIEVRGVVVLQLLKLHHMNGDIEPLATLWKPEFVHANAASFFFSGLERKAKRWNAQAWRLEVLTPGEATNYFKARKIEGELPVSHS